MELLDNASTFILFDNANFERIRLQTFLTTHFWYSDNAIFERIR